MGYFLGIDLGTTFTAAAVMRDDRPEIVTLGNRAAAIPSLVFVHDDTVLTGEAALRRGLAEPDRLAREFKRRVGDPAPILLGGVPLSAEALFGRLLRATVDVVAEREGGAPDGIAVCHPANWGPYKLELLDQACRLAELDGVMTISEPEAAAIHYAALERVEVGALVAVYDLGGGTFDAAVLRKTDGGFEILGAPEGIERLGGIDFDEAVLNHVRAALPDELAAIDPDEPATLAALARLRQECVEAKEALSADVETSIPVMLPGVNTEVRLTRTEFEAMIRLPIQETIAALGRALRGAGVAPEDLAAVLLVGGSSRIPMVAEMVGAEVGRPVAVDAEPKHVVALGAARAVGSRVHEPVLVASTALRETVVAAPPAPPEPVTDPVVATTSEAPTESPSTERAPVASEPDSPVRVPPRAAAPAAPGAASPAAPVADRRRRGRRRRTRRRRCGDRAREQQRRLVRRIRVRVPRSGASRRLHHVGVLRRQPSRRRVHDARSRPGAHRDGRRCRERLLPGTGVREAGGFGAQPE